MQVIGIANRFLASEKIERGKRTVSVCSGIEEVKPDALLTMVIPLKVDD
jgi:hypothetical protein